MRELQQLNNIDVEIPQNNMDEILEDPKQYALDFVEASFAKHLPKYLKSYKLGIGFEDKNMGK